MFQKKQNKKKNCRKYLFSRSVCLKTSSSLWDINNNINVNIKKNKGSLKICSQSSYFNQFGSLAVLHYLEFS